MSTLRMAFHRLRVEAWAQSLATLRTPAFALPSLFFHITTAYAILRHRGVPLGKRDFLGNYLSN